MGWGETSLCCLALSCRLQLKQRAGSCRVQPCSSCPCPHHPEVQGMSGTGSCSAAVCPGALAGVGDSALCVLQEQSLLQPPTLQLLNGMGPLGRRASDGGANIQLHAQQLLKRPRGPSPLVTMTPVSSTELPNIPSRKQRCLCPAHSRHSAAGMCCSLPKLPLAALRSPGGARWGCVFLSGVVCSSLELFVHFFMVAFVLC